MRRDRTWAPVVMTVGAVAAVAKLALLVLALGAVAWALAGAP